MDKGSRLFGNRPCHRGMAVPEAADRDSRGKVKILPSVTVPESASGAPREENVGLRVGFHDVPVVEINAFLGQSSMHLQDFLHKIIFLLRQ